MDGVSVYWNTDLKPTPNLPIVCSSSSFVEQPTDVIELISPISPVCSLASVIENWRLPLCLKTNLSLNNRILTFVAAVSSAFCINSYIK